MPNQDIEMYASPFLGMLDPGENYSGAGKMYMVNPASLTSPEAEGADAIALADTTRKIPVMWLGPGAPDRPFVVKPIGDRHFAGAGIVVCSITAKGTVGTIKYPWINYNPYMCIVSTGVEIPPVGSPAPPPAGKVNPGNSAAGRGLLTKTWGVAGNYDVYFLMKCHRPVVFLDQAMECGMTYDFGTINFDAQDSTAMGCACSNIFDSAAIYGTSGGVYQLTGWDTFNLSDSMGECVLAQDSSNGQVGVYLRSFTGAIEFDGPEGHFRAAYSVQCNICDPKSVMPPKCPYVLNVSLSVGRWIQDPTYQTWGYLTQYNAGSDPANPVWVASPEAEGSIALDMDLVDLLARPVDWIATIPVVKRTGLRTGGRWYGDVAPYSSIEAIDPYGGSSTATITQPWNGWPKT